MAPGWKSRNETESKNRCARNVAMNVFKQRVSLSLSLRIGANRFLPARNFQCRGWTGFERVSVPRSFERISGESRAVLTLTRVPDSRFLRRREIRSAARPPCYVYTCITRVSKRSRAYIWMHPNYLGQSWVFLFNYFVWWIIKRVKSLG